MKAITPPPDASISSHNRPYSSPISVVDKRQSPFDAIFGIYARLTEHKQIRIEAQQAKPRVVIPRKITTFYELLRSLNRAETPSIRATTKVEFKIKQRMTKTVVHRIAQHLPQAVVDLMKLSEATNEVFQEQEIQQGALDECTKKLVVSFLPRVLFDAKLFSNPGGCIRAAAKPCAVTPIKCIRAAAKPCAVTPIKCIRAAAKPCAVTPIKCIKVTAKPWTPSTNSGGGGDKSTTAQKKSSRHQNFIPTLNGDSPQDSATMTDLEFLEYTVATYERTIFRGTPAESRYFDLNADESEGSDDEWFEDLGEHMGIEPETSKPLHKIFIEKVCQETWQGSLSEMRALAETADRVKNNIFSNSA